MTPNPERPPLFLHGSVWLGHDPEGNDLGRIQVDAGDAGEPTDFPPFRVSLKWIRPGAVAELAAYDLDRCPSYDVLLGYVAALACAKSHEYDEARSALADCPTDEGTSHAWAELDRAQRECPCVPCSARRATVVT